jgi:hypothetical protein
MDRRSAKYRRRPYHLARLTYRGPERRDGEERRLKGKRRSGWIRMSQWWSVYLKRLKIAKFLG